MLIVIFYNCNLFGSNATTTFFSSFFSVFSGPKIKSNEKLMWFWLKFLFLTCLSNKHTKNAKKSKKSKHFFGPRFSFIKHFFSHAKWIFLFDPTKKNLENKKNLALKNAQEFLQLSVRPFLAAAAWKPDSCWSEKISVQNLWIFFWREQPKKTKMRKVLFAANE